MRVVLDFRILPLGRNLRPHPGAEPDRCNPGSHAEQEFGCLADLVSLAKSQLKSETLGHAR